MVKAVLSILWRQMVNWKNEPLGMIRLDELANILNALALTDCDQRTLAVVARAVGVSKFLELPTRPIVVELPAKRLEASVK